MAKRNQHTAQLALKVGIGVLALGALFCSAFIIAVPAKAVEAGEEAVNKIAKKRPIEEMNGKVFRELVVRDFIRKSNIPRNGIGYGDVTDKKHRNNCDSLLERYNFENIEFHVLYDTLKQNDFPPECDTYLFFGMVDSCEKDRVAMQSKSFQFRFMHYGTTFPPSKVVIVVDVKDGSVTNAMCRCFSAK